MLRYFEHLANRKRWVDKIVNYIYQRGAFSIVSEAYKAFNDLLDNKRSKREMMKGFESRFFDQVAKSNAISESRKLPECLTALISNSYVSDV